MIEILRKHPKPWSWDGCGYGEQWIEDAKGNSIKLADVLNYIEYLEAQREYYLQKTISLADDNSQLRQSIANLRHLDTSIIKRAYKELDGRNIDGSLK